MAETKPVRFRPKPEIRNALQLTKKRKQFSTMSDTVAYLIETGIIHEEERLREIQKCRDRLIELEAKYHELSLPDFTKKLRQKH